MIRRWRRRRRALRELSDAWERGASIDFDVTQQLGELRRAQQASYSHVNARMSNVEEDVAQSRRAILAELEALNRQLGRS